MNILFVGSTGIIAADPPKSRKLFIDTLGLPLERYQNDEYFFSEKIEGSKHFGIWPLSEAAESCFGTKEWPKDKPAPQATVEFEMTDKDSVYSGAEELKEKGYKLIHEARTEPWGQTIVRLLTHEGLLIGLSYAPWLHEEK